MIAVSEISKKMTNVRHITSVVLLTAFLECYISQVGTTLLMSAKDLRRQSMRRSEGHNRSESVAYHVKRCFHLNPGKYRTREEVEEWRRKSKTFAKHLLENEIASAKEPDQIQEKVKKQWKQWNFAEKKAHSLHLNQLHRGIFTPN